MSSFELGERVGILSRLGITGSVMTANGVMSGKSNDRHQLTSFFPSLLGVISGVQ